MGANPITGFVISAGKTSIKGFTIIRFPSGGIELAGPNGGNVIQANVIGTDGRDARIVWLNQRSRP